MAETVSRGNFPPHDLQGLPLSGDTKTRYLSGIAESGLIKWGMQPPKTQVTIYLHNRVDEAIQVDPDTLPNLFIAALEREDYKPSGRLSYEFEYRWWLTGPEKTGGMAATWDEADFPALFNPFIARLNDDAEYKDRVWARMDPS